MGKTNLKTLIVITFLVIISLSATYAYVELNDNKNNAVGQAGCFNVNYFES